jgi:hypothetical protein
MDFPIYHKLILLNSSGGGGYINIFFVIIFLFKRIPDILVKFLKKYRKRNMPALRDGTAGMTSPPVWQKH